MPVGDQVLITLMKKKIMSYLPIKNASLVYLKAMPLTFLIIGYHFRLKTDGLGSLGFLGETLGKSAVQLSIKVPEDNCAKQTCNDQQSLNQGWKLIVIINTVNSLVGQIILFEKVLVVMPLSNSCLKHQDFFFIATR